MTSRAQALLQKAVRRLGFQRDWYLILFGAAIGCVTALGAIGFMKLLHGAEHLANHLLAGWPWWTLPLFPIIGGLGAGLLIHYFAAEARGHGVPEVIDAIHTRSGRIRPRVAIIKALASACTIGSGGSAGAEGPIVQIGSAIGSGGAQVMRMSRNHIPTLLGCGAAAGIASVFNAPIAGVFFVLEIILRDFSLRTFTPIVVASVFSTVVTQTVLEKTDAIFAVPMDATSYHFTFQEMPSYFVLGLACGLIAVGFIRALYWSEDLAERARLHPVFKPVVGAALLGLLGVGYLALSHQLGQGRALPPFFGNGYSTITKLLDPLTYGPATAGSAVHVTLAIAVALLVCKLAATCLTLGSGGSGGVFAPSLFMGATTGAVLGGVLERIGLLPSGASPAEYALVGMAALVAGTTHAPLTAILIVFEITRDPYVLLPLMLASIVSVVVAQLVFPDSIYMLKLRRRGVLTGTAADLSVLRRLIARETELAPHVEVHVDDPVSKLLDLHRRHRAFDFVVVNKDGSYMGMVSGYDLRTALVDREVMPLLLVSDLLRAELPAVDPDESLDSVLRKFNKHGVACLTVATTGAATSHGRAAGRKPMGLVTRTGLMQRYQDALFKS